MAETGTGTRLAGVGKAPRTKRGEKTMRRILDAALVEFGNSGFSETSIVAITKRAEVALGTFYTYFDSKEALFAALVQDMSLRVRDRVAPALSDSVDALDNEANALAAYLGFVADHKEVYRIIDESEFVDPEGFRRHYETTAARISDRLRAGQETGAVRATSDEEREALAWAMMGMNVFLGLRFGVWGEGQPDKVSGYARHFLRNGIASN